MQSNRLTSGPGRGSEAGNCSWNFSTPGRSPLLDRSPNSTDMAGFCYQPHPHSAGENGPFLRSTALAEEHHSGRRHLERTPGSEKLLEAKGGLESTGDDSYSGACWGTRLRRNPSRTFLTSFQPYFVRIPSLSFPWKHPLNTQLAGESHSTSRGPDIRQSLLFCLEFSFPTQPRAESQP